MRAALSAVLAVAFLAVAGLTMAADPTPQSHLGVTIEAAKQRQALRQEVDHFVDAVVTEPRDDAPYRWAEPVCPLVAGLPRAAGELILQRISQAAVDARAPLDGRVCHPNLFVVVIDSPERLLQEWWARDRQMYAYDTNGIEAVESFVHSGRPIRAWYNTGLRCNGGVSFGPGISPMLGIDLPNFLPLACKLADSRLSRSSIATNITSAIVVVDLRQMKQVSVGQMADYIALVGLAGLRLDADPGPQQSILRLFAAGESAPQGLSTWDRALLYSLYNTDQWVVLQLSEIKATMVSRLAP